MFLQLLDGAIPNVWIVIAALCTAVWWQSRLSTTTTQAVRLLTQVDDEITPRPADVTVTATRDDEATSKVDLSLGLKDSPDLRRRIWAAYAFCEYSYAAFSQLSQSSSTNRFPPKGNISLPRFGEYEHIDEKFTAGFTNPRLHPALMGTPL